MLWRGLSLDHSIDSSAFGLLWRWLAFRLQRGQRGCVEQLRSRQLLQQIVGNIQLRQGKVGRCRLRFRNRLLPVHGRQLLQGEVQFRHGKCGLAPGSLGIGAVLCSLGLEVLRPFLHFGGQRGGQLRHWLVRCSGFHLGHVPHWLHALRALGATWNQGHVGTLALQTHGVGGSSEGRGRPALRLPVLDILGPGSKGFQGILSQLLHGLRHGPLLCQPGIEHLLHGPAGFAKLIQPHHARAALERVKRTAQRGLLAQIARLIGQSLKGLQAVIHDFTGFLQEDGQQLIIAIQLFGAQLGSSGQGLCRSNCWAARAGRILACMRSGDGLIRCRSARLHVSKHLGHGIGQGIGACHRRLGRHRCRP